MTRSPLFLQNDDCPKNTPLQKNLQDYQNSDTISHTDLAKKKQEIQTLSTLIEKYNQQYYLENQSEVSDQVYDELFQKLKQLEAQYPELIQKNSPTQTVGVVLNAKSFDKFQKMPHPSKMLSLNNALNFEELTHFYRQTQQNLYKNGLLETPNQEVAFFAELKFDGLAVNLIYQQGRLQYAATRGDGEVGENITHNILQITQLPKLLNNASDAPELLEIRGEVIFFHEDFAALNQELANQGKKQFANPRNAAAGTLRQLEAGVTKNRCLHFLAYGLGKGDDAFATQNDALKQLQNWGFETVLSINPEYQFLAFDLYDLQSFYQRMLMQRTQLPFDIDGLVYKVNATAWQKQLGLISRSPKWAIAHKFPPAQARAKLLAIEVQVGRTGALTPVARLEPTYLAGVEISNATLHNQQEIQRKNIAVGDVVIIQRAADVIPEIVSVAQPSPFRQAFNMPEACPICQSPVIKGETIWRCSGVDVCSAQIHGRLKHFVSRKAMNMAGLGEQILLQFHELGLVKNLADLYGLTADDLAKIPRMGEKSIQNILAAIQLSKKPKLDKFIYALGIHHVGEKTSKDLARHFQSITALQNASFEDLLNIHDVGDVVAKSIIDYFNHHGQQIVGDLLKYIELPTPSHTLPLLPSANSLIDLNLDLNPLNIENAVLDQQMPLALSSILGSNPLSHLNVEEITALRLKLTGKYILITGSFKESREKIAEKIGALGAFIEGSFTKRTQLLFAGEKAGSKLQKAQNQGIEIWQQDEVEQILKL